MKEIFIFIGAVIIVMEIAYRLFDYAVHKMSNLAGEMETLEEE